MSRLLDVFDPCIEGREISGLIENDSGQVEIFTSRVKSVLHGRPFIERYGWWWGRRNLD